MNRDSLVGAPYGLDCEACPRGAERIGAARCRTWGTLTAAETGYKHEGKSMLGREWQACPAWYLRSPEAVILTRWTNHALRYPMPDPDTLAAWVEVGVREIRAALDEQQAERMRAETARMRR